MDLDEFMDTTRIRACFFAFEFKLLLISETTIGEILGGTIVITMEWSMIMQSVFGVMVPWMNEVNKPMDDW